MQSIDPTTGARLEEYPALAPAQAAARLAAAAAAQRAWGRSAFDERAGLLRAVAAELRKGAPELAELMAREMGKPLAAGRGEVEKCAWVCEYYAEHGASFLAPEAVPTEASRSFVAFAPLGVVLAVMPWNFPLWQVFRFAAPALMAGNGAALKHASNVCGCALAIESLLQRAGAPRDLFHTLLVGGARVAELIAHPDVAAVTLTGSTPAGRSVARSAGEQLKKSVLELGGSDPYLILEDADLEQAVAACVTSRLINSGQSCIAAKRFILPRSRRAELEERFVAAMAAPRVGNPLDAEVDLGPLARADLREELHEQVTRSVAAGCRLLLGGELPEGPGAFYPATVLSEVGPEAPVYREETFGPVASLIFVDDEEEAIRVANDSCFGLGAAVFTADRERGTRIAQHELAAGCCFVNDFVRSDPRLPFGGIKESGYGRELGPFGIREFVNIKTVCVA